MKVIHVWINTLIFLLRNSINSLSTPAASSSSLLVGERDLDLDLAFSSSFPGCDILALFMHTVSLALQQ